MEGKTNFQGAYRLSGAGIVERLEIIDVRCNLKQFDGLTSMTLAPDFTTDLRHWWQAVASDDFNTASGSSLESYPILTSAMFTCVCLILMFFII